MSEFQTFALVAVLFIAGALLINFAPVWNTARMRKLATRWIKALVHDQQGGYVHDTAMSQYIPPTEFHCVTGTFTHAAGDVAGTIAINRAAANETSVITIPITLPSNSVAQKGAKLVSIEVDYEVKGAEPTSLTWTLNKVTRGADTAVAVVAAVTKTNTVADAAAKTVDQHKQKITLSTAAWIDNDEYYLLELSLVAGAGGGTEKFLGAVANFTLRM
jgi:hypothetical protein